MHAIPSVALVMSNTRFIILVSNADVMPPRYRVALLGG